MTAPAPGYWMDETTGVLRPAVEAYLHGEPMTAAHLAAMRAYLRQWIAAPVWAGDRVELLRATVDDITCRQGLDLWLDAAMKEGIDPL